MVGGWVGQNQHLVLYLRLLDIIPHTGGREGSYFGNGGRRLYPPAVVGD